MSAVLTGGWRSENTGDRLWRSFGVALCLEVGFVAVVVAWVASHPPKLPELVIPLSIEAIAPAEPEKPPIPVKQPLPLPQPQLQPPRPISPVTPLPQPAPVPTPVPAVPVQASTAPVTQAVATPSPAPAPIMRSVPVQAVDPTLAYNAKLTAAAQAAFEVPGTVTALNFKGRTRVGFKLRDAVPFSIAIVQSSGLGAMDRAATKAVQTAAFPQPPVALQGQELSYEIWVTHTSAN